MERNVMKGYLIVLGAALGAWRRGLGGAVVGAGVGWMIGSLTGLVRSDAAPTMAGEDHYLRYPEEEILDALQDAKDETASEEAELDDLYRQVTGRR